MNFWKNTMTFARVLGTLALLLLSNGLVLAQDNAQYEITVTNLTRDQRFTPVLAVTHDEDVSLFTAGQPASPELATLAEEGNTVPLEGLLTSLPGVRDVVSSAGLLSPGASVTLNLTGRGRLDRISMAAMLIPTNDAFFAIDLTFEAIQELGQIHFHGVALHPAKPVILADVSGIPVLGLPGYPVAAYIASFIYLRPLVLSLSKIEWKAKQDVFISAEDIPAKDVDCFYRVCLYDVDGRIYAKRILQGAGSILSVSRMDGLMHVPPGIEIHKRDGVRVDILNERWQTTLAVQGIRDSNVLRLFEFFHQTFPPHRILFWDAPMKEALQSMIERNAHMAVIAAEEDSNPFPEYAAQLQEPMLRFPLFTRDSKIQTDLIVLESHFDLPAVRHLVDLASSSEFEQHIRSQEGCEMPPSVIDHH